MIGSGLLSSLSLGCSPVDVGVSDDGNVVGALCSNKNLYIYHRQNGTYSLNTTLSHSEDVKAVSVSGDGEFVAVNRNKRLKVYEKASSYAAVISYSTEGDYGAVLYHSDSNQVFSSNAKDIRYFQGNPPTYIGQLSEPNAVFNDLSCTSSGDRMAGGGEDKKVYVYDRTTPPTFTLLQTLSFSDEIYGVHLTDDEKYLFVADKYGSLKALKKNSSDQYQLVDSVSTSINVRSMIVNPDGRITVGGESTTLKTYSFDETTDTFALEETITGLSSNLASM